jgi:lipopolysaccharide export system permease protein
MKLLPGKTYTRFLIREFIKVFFVCIVFIMGLSFIVRTLQRADSSKTYTLVQTLMLRLIEAPEIISRECLLASSMFAAVYTMSILSKNREILALRSCGVSMYRIITPLILLGFLISILSLVFENFVVVRSYGLEKRYKAKITGEQFVSYYTDRYNLIVFGRDNVVYKIVRYVSSEEAMDGVTVIKKDGQGTVEYRIDAQKAVWDGSRWVFYSGVLLRFAEDGELSKTVNFKKLPTDIADEPRYFARDVRKIENMTFSHGYEYIMMKKKMGFGYRGELTRYHRKIANGFTYFLVIIIGLSLGSMSFKNALVMSFSMTLGIVLVFFFIIEIGYTFGSSGKLPPAIGGWMGNMLFSAVGIFMLKIIRK